VSVFEQAKGKVKEAFGDTTDNKALKKEGEAQVDKGYEESKATQAKAEAQAHEKKAELHEQEQKLAEETS
jgi:uncharacterized protein YjbJ (UPF0337 family)